MNSHPPRLAKHLLLSFLRADLAEEVSGDLEEKFFKTINTKGKFRAKVNYWYQVMLYLRPFAIKRKFNRINPNFMIRHTILISLRNYKRYKSSFVINLVGLSSGLAAALLICLWVLDEISMDRFHRKDLYQVMRTLEESPGQVWTFDGNSDLLAPALLQDIPEVDKAISVTRTFTDGILSTSERGVRAKGKFAGTGFFTLFSFPLVHGEATRVLKDKYAMVISDELAIRLFGTTRDVLGKSVTWDLQPFEGTYIVTGVFGTSGYNSSEAFDFVLNHEVFMGKNNQYWDNNNVQTFMTLKDGVTPETFNLKYGNFVKEKFKALYGSENLGFIAALFIRPYADKYLYNRYENGVLAGGRIDYVMLLSTVAAFILVIACINFMNLSTARASRRLKEVGIKKAMGAFRRTLAFQYLGESLFLTFLSLATAVLLVFLILPQFNSITGKDLALTLNLNIIGGGFLIALVTGLFAGSYPALRLSGMKTSDVLKGKLLTSFVDLWTRRGLVAFQFTASTILIIAVVIIYQQMNFVKTKNLGYRTENIVTIDTNKNLDKSLESFLAQARNIAGVENAAGTGYETGMSGETGRVEWEGKKDRVEFNVHEVGYDFIELLDIPLRAGRSFSRDFSTENTKLIVNEMAARTIGMTDPVGKKIKLWDQEYEIVGVTKDFHIRSLYDPILPCLIKLNDHPRNILVGVEQGKESEVILALESLYHQFNPGIPFEYHFLDDEYQALYSSEQKVSDLAGYFAFIAVLISCLGLFGLAAFTAERRTKEISIRKILGSSGTAIVWLLSKDFVRIVAISALIALPSGYLLAEKYLEGFAYKIELEWWYFAASGLLAFGIAWLTVSIQTLKAANVNPVENLRNE